jgi:hypothetical protein
MCGIGTLLLVGSIGTTIAIDSTSPKKALTLRGLLLPVLLDPIKHPRPVLSHTQNNLKCNLRLDLRY